MTGTLFYTIDQDKNVMKLGFSMGAPFESQYKMRADYMTGTLFAAERRDVRSYKEM